MRPIVWILLALPSTAAADPFRWIDPELETSWVDSPGDGELEIEEKRQFAGSSYFDVQVTVTWRSHRGEMPVATIVFFGRCAGSVDTRVEGDRLVVVSRCGKWDDHVRTDTWKFDERTHAFRRLASSTVSPWNAAARRIQRLLARAKLREAYARLEEIGTSYNGQRGLEGYWLLLFLDAARATEDAAEVAFVARAEAFGSDRWREVLRAAENEDRAAWVLNECAYLLYLAGENDLAIEILEPLVEEVPDRTVANLNLADAYWKRGGDDAQERARVAYERYREARRAQGKHVPARVRERLEAP